jgi:hypothetical protein
MISISRSLLLAAGLLAFPLAGAVAQAVDTGKSTGPSSASGSDKSVDSKNGGSAMKSTAPAYENKSDVAGGVSKSTPVMRRPLGNQENSRSKDRGFAEATRTRSGRKGPPGDSSSGRVTFPGAL